MSHLFRSASEMDPEAMLSFSPVFARPGEATELPAFEIPDGLMDPDTCLLYTSRCV